MVLYTFQNPGFIFEADREKHHGHGHSKRVFREERLFRENLPIFQIMKIDNECEKVGRPLTLLVINTFETKYYDQQLAK